MDPETFWVENKPKMQPESIPCQCEVILLDMVIIDTNGKIIANKSETFDFEL